MSPRIGSAGRPRVTAVVVSHDGDRWLPTLVRALDSSSVKPDRTVCVDTGSSDSSRDYLVGAFSEAAVVDAPFRTGFGTAVGIGLSALDAGAARATTCEDPATDPGPAAPGEWVWLLHDDCAPASYTLEHLLATAATDPSIAVVGCRLRAWPRGRRLLEVGVTITGTGRRETGLEPGEYDQGQHDGVRTVLAVSSAGMLVRRQVWDRLGGFDSRLPLFRDDVDFGWRVARAGSRVVVSPGARMFHAEASTRGIRAIANSDASPHRADRKAAIFTVLANVSTAALAWQYARLVVGSALRALGYMLGKLPGAAYDEMAAVLAVALRPDRVVAARVARRRTATVGRRQLRPLFPPWWTPYLGGLDAVLTLFAGSARNAGTGVSTSARRLSVRRDDTAFSETDQKPAPAGSLRLAGGPSSWVREHGLLVLLVVLTMAALSAARGLVGGGLLHGGALLPAPGGARDWWRLYRETHHGVGLGSDLATAPYVAALGLLGALALGKAWLVVDALMLLASPLAAVGAYVAASRLVASVPVRVWMAATYALVPVLTGSVTTGHIGTVAASVLLPWFVLAALTLVADDGGPTWQAASASGLALAVLTAFAPLSWVMTATVFLLALPISVVRGQVRTIPFAAAALALPFVLLAPWSLGVLADPGSAVVEAGLVDASTASVTNVAWQLPFGRLAADGAAPWGLTAGVLAAAVLAVWRRDRRTGIAGAWLVLAVALSTAGLLSHQTASVPGADRLAFVWLGLPVVVAQGAAVVAAGLGADGLVSVIRQGSFGLRQPVVAVVGVAALAAPVAGLAWMALVAPQGELLRQDLTALPAYMSDALETDPSQRALVIRRDDDAVTYQLVAGDGLRLGDDSVLPDGGSRGLSDLVGDLLSETRPADVPRLAALGVSYVVLPSPANPADVAQLDGLPGLTRASTDSEALHGWQVPAHPDANGSAGGASAGVGGAPAADQPAIVSAHRRWWLAGEGAAWLLAIVLATPALPRRAGMVELDR